MSYEKLEARFRELAHLEHAKEMLAWDEAVMMPAGSGEARGQAMATLAGITHERLCAPELGDLFAAAQHTGAERSFMQKANLREMLRVWRDATALPADLVRARQIAVTRCEQVWREKRANNDWQGVLPHLQEVLARVRDVATCYLEADATRVVHTPEFSAHSAAGASGGKVERTSTAERGSAAYDTALYDTLLTRHQPGIGSAEVDQIFSGLQVFLPDLIEQVRSAQPHCLPFVASYSVARQQALGERLMRMLGFDFEHGRLDVSHHPFTGGVPDDTRITTRYTESSFLPAQMGVLHETGHGLYAQGLPAAWREQPIGTAAGMAVHESQSLLMEMQVARSKPFLAHVAPIMCEMLEGERQFAGAPTDAQRTGEKWSGENLYRHATQVRPGFIRVDADELTYPLHVIIRFDLERRLLSGRLPLADLPDAWDLAMREYLGLSTRGNDRDGCMQDVHWFAGSFGYFPCYTLGALMAAQLFAAARRAIPNVETLIGNGDLGALREWLRAQVHGRGRLFSLQELMVEVCGERLDARYFQVHLQRRYLRQAW